MNNLKYEQFKKSIEINYGQSHLEDKEREYFDAFFNREATEDSIKAKVQGNYGTYRTSLKRLKSGFIKSSCSCYMGSGCKHTYALAHTFLKKTDTFNFKVKVVPKTVKNLQDVQLMLEAKTLEEIMFALRKKKITQKDLAESIGTTSAHIGKLKSGEQKGYIYKELGAVKLAAIWVLDNIKK